MFLYAIMNTFQSMNLSTIAALLVKTVLMINHLMNTRGYSECMKSP